MGRSKGKRLRPAAPVYDSDDERTYKDEKIPDKEDDSYFYDDVDEFHATRDKILLDKGASLPQHHESSSEEEIMAIESEDSDDDDEDLTEYERQLSKFRIQKMDDEMGSDLEGKGGNDDLPDDRAWGKVKHKFYGADVDEDDADFSGSEPGDAELEEEEVRAIQKRMAEQLDDQDFGLDILRPVDVTSKSDEIKEKEKIKKDLSKLSKKEKLQLLKKESPELLDLIADYKLRMIELKDRLLPVQELVKNGILPKGKAAEYVETKFRLILSYCVNISFYLMLKAKQTPVHNHPVIGRLVQYRNLLKQLEPIDNQLSEEMDLILEKLQSGEVITMETQKVDKKKKRDKKKLTKKEKRKLSELLADEEGLSGDDKKAKKKAKKLEGKFETRDEREALEYYEMMKLGRKVEEEMLEEGQPGENDGDRPAGNEGEEGYGDGENEEMGKRAIGYQIEKNKGLTPHRKKELRNPRVKHRMKYRKAKIRRKGQIREVRTEMSRYGGELSGIRAGIKRSVRLK
ncbi:something about silencing protein 10-like [Lineus longissimus]|uniref:something about silencing protein 10-like n=1 Tax=Lineus longissimus TaxID=88925 RepID=UPI002B4C284F